LGGGDVPKLPEDRHERFAQEYIKDLNGAQAAVRAGYSEKTARQQGSRLLTNADVAQRISELQAERAKRTQIDADRILLELYRIATVDVGLAFDDAGQMKPLKDIPEDVRRSISGLEVHEIFDGQGDQKHAIGLAKKIKFWDKPRALELLGKHLSLFIERIKIEEVEDVEWVDDAET
jgi:phage terminase small subunit